MLLLLLLLLLLPPLEWCVEDEGLEWRPSSFALAIALQHLWFSRRSSSEESNRVHAQKQQDDDKVSPSRAASLQTLLSDVARAGITRSWRCDHLAKFGGRRGVQRRVGKQSRGGAREERCEGGRCSDIDGSSPKKGLHSLHSLLSGLSKRGLHPDDDVDEHRGVERQRKLSS